MRTKLTTQLRHGLLVLVAAAILAVASTVAPAALDKMAGTSLTTHAYACEAPIGGC
ncbi:MAG: hypothetical protein U0350_35720 [Caldilineaceae bacterium]